MLGVTPLPGGLQIYSLHAIGTRISSGLLKHLTSMQSTLPYLTVTGIISAKVLHVLQEATLFLIVGHIHLLFSLQTHCVIFCPRFE